MITKAQADRIETFSFENANQALDAQLLGMVLAGLVTVHVEANDRATAYLRAHLTQSGAIEKAVFDTHPPDDDASAEGVSIRPRYSKSPCAGVARIDSEFGRGVQHTVDLLAKTLGVTDWALGDGSEDHDTDLANTMLNILEAKGLYDRFEGEFADLNRSVRMVALEQAAQEADVFATGPTAKVAHDIAQAIRALMLPRGGKPIDTGAVRQSIVGATPAAGDWPTTQEAVPVDQWPKEIDEDVLIYVVHPQAHLESDEKVRRSNWEGWFKARWTEHNGGGWVWHGMLGTVTHVAPYILPTLDISPIEESIQAKP